MYVHGKGRRQSLTPHCWRACFADAANLPLPGLKWAPQLVASLSPQEDTKDNCRDEEDQSSMIYFVFVSLLSARIVQPSVTE